MTRCRVGIKRGELVTSMYIHCDGYPKKPGVGFELQRGYTTTELVEALVARGELSGLESTLAKSHGYDDAHQPITHPAEHWPESGQEHEYLWDGATSTWFYRTDGRARAFGMGAAITTPWVLLAEQGGAQPAPGGAQPAPGGVRS